MSWEGSTRDYEYPPTPDREKKALDRLLADIPRLGNRATIARFIKEKRINGRKSGTLLNNAHLVRELCLHLGSKALEEVTRPDVAAFVDTYSRERTWGSVGLDGRETMTRRLVPLGASTVAERKSVLRRFFKWLRGTDQ